MNKDVRNMWENIFPNQHKTKLRHVTPPQRHSDGNIDQRPKRFENRDEHCVTARASLGEAL